MSHRYNKQEQSLIIFEIKIHLIDTYLIYPCVLI